MKFVHNYVWLLAMVSVIFFGCIDLQASNIITFSNSDIANSTFTFATPGSYAFDNTLTYNYSPINVSVSTPMIKIVASDVTIDFRNIGIYNTDTSSAGWVGIEIGWTPAELIADPTRIQPNNITIKNLSLYSFDAGILLHAGVQSVYIKNCKLHDIVLSIGVLGTTDNICQDFNVDHVTIFGYRDNFHTALVNMKTLIETTYDYGADYLMPLRADPLNSDTVDVYTYYGMWVNNLIIADIKNLGIYKIGYPNYESVSEGNGQRSEGIGFRIQNSTRLVMHNVFTSEIYSELKAVGLQLDGVREIEIYDSSFSYSVSATKAVGLEVTNDNSLAYSVETLKLHTIETKSNSATSGTAIGMDITSVRGVRGTDILSKYNTGSLAAYGLYSTKLYTVNLQDSFFNENSATRVVNDVATTQGIVAAGLYGVNANSIKLSNVDCGSNQALNSAYGLYLDNSANCQFSDCAFTGNIATSMRSGEAAAIRSQQDGQEISKHGPCVAAATTGGYGVFLTGSRNFKFEDSSSLSNAGHRAMGFSIQNCRGIALRGCFAAGQTATGQMLDSSFLTDNVANPTAIPIISYHKPLLFGDLTKTTVDAVTATDLFLTSLETVRAAQLAGSDPAYSDIKTILATSSLLQATIARYRIWSVAMGIQAHNVSGLLLGNCTCNGQVSLFDSGIGVCCSGRNTGYLIEDSELLFNVGAYYSAQTAPTDLAALYNYSYNLLGFALFWKTLLMNLTPWSILTSASLGVDVTCMSFSPDGTLLAVGAADNNVYVYDTSTWALAHTLSGHTTAITAVAFRPDATQLATSDTAASNNVKIWDTTAWTVSQNLTQPSGVVYALAWNPDSSELASGGTGSSGNNVRIWDSTSWSNTHTVSHGTATVQALAWSPSGTRLVSGSSDATDNMMVWDTSLWTSTDTLSDHTDSVTSLSYNTAGTLLASGSVDTTVKVWETTGWTVSHTLSGSAGTVNAVQFKPDDKLIAAACASNVVKVWKTSSWGTLETTLTDFTGPALTLAWNDTGRLLATGSSDNSYRIYNANIWKKAATTDDIGIYTGSSNYIAQDSLIFGSDIDGNSVFIDLKGTQHNLVSPIGPVGAGLVMGDMMVEGIVQRNSTYTNLGNAGHSYGVLLDKAFSVTLDSNIISGNSVNAHGFVAGVMDVTTSSPNLFMQNTLEGNKCSIFNNSNYIVPFNPDDPNTLAFPVQQFMNGKFLSVATTSYDNIEFQYSLDSTVYPFESLLTIPIDSNLRAYLTSSNCWS